MSKFRIPPLNRPLADGGPQFVPQQIGAGTNRGVYNPLPGTQIPPTATDLPTPSGITQKVASSLAFARIIDFSLDTVEKQSKNFLNSTDAYRNYLMLRNASAAADIYIGFGTDASPRSTLKLVAGSSIILFDAVVPQDDLYYYASAAGGVLCCAYSTVKPDWKL
jgi:hypothetical protein